MEYGVSVVIVNWNTKDLLAQCLESLKKNTHHLTYEMIVVDNASGDGSPEMVKEKFPDVTLIPNRENRGFGRANNQGLQIAQGKYILFLNSDVVVSDSCLDRMYKFMEENPEVGASSCKLLNPDGTLQHSCRKFPDFKTFFPMLLGLRSLFPHLKVFRDYQMLDWDHSDIREVDQIMGSFMFIRKKALDQVGGFDERFWMYFEEVDLCLRLHQGGWKIVHYPSASAVHFLSQSAGQWREAKKIYEFHQSMLKYFHKNKSFFSYAILYVFSQFKFSILYFFQNINFRKKGEKNI